MANILLKRAALKGFTLYEIGQILYKEDPDIPSPMEKIIKRTQDYMEYLKAAHLLKIQNATPPGAVNKGYRSFENFENKARLAKKIFDKSPDT